jgi:transcriptional regulator with XRE-family HTH domain
MTPAQCRAARGLVNLTQTEVAARASLGLSTVVDFERERRTVSAEAVEAIRRALESAGVIFVEGNGDGPGVRLRRAADAGKEPAAISDEAAIPEIPDDDGEPYDGAPV